MDDRARIDAVLEVGSTADQVTVVAEAPLVEEFHGAGGQVVSQEQITSLPLDGHNPFSLMDVAAGVNYTGSMLYSRPFDNGAIADFSISGGVAGVNEYQIDGVSNNANTGRSNLATSLRRRLRRNSAWRPICTTRSSGGAAAGWSTFSIKPHQPLPRRGL